MQGPSGGPSPDYPEPVDCGEVMFAALGEPAPDGWTLAGPLQGHHGHWSCLVRREPGETMKASEIAKQAADLVDGDRATTYGDGGDAAFNFGRIAILWNAWRKVRRDPDAPFDAVDVAQMLSLMKKVRGESGPHKDDHAIDDCGYAAHAGAIAASTRSSR